MLMWFKSSWIVENVASENYRHLTEKDKNFKFLSSDKPKNHSTGGEGKARRVKEKKQKFELLVFIFATLEILLSDEDFGR